MNDNDKKVIDKIIDKLAKSHPPPCGYSYFLPSPNKGKRLLIIGWIDPWKASQIAIKILKGEATVDDFDCVEEID